jgi:membrane-associated phospholipid phosphatase
MNPYLSILGYQGPNILMVLILLAYYFSPNPHPTLFFYPAVLAWQVASHLLNVVIKNTLKLPRPDSKPEEFNEMRNTLTWKNYLTLHRNFGMPSGHAQATVSELIFISLYFKNNWLTTFALLQTGLTLWQRYTTRRHSVKQLAAGSLIGVVVGVLFYFVIKS